jgi:hypothetical protein
MSKKGHNIMEDSEGPDELPTDELHSRVFIDDDGNSAVIGFCLVVLMLIMGIAWVFAPFFI